MYIVEFHNLLPNDEVDAEGGNAAHRAFLARYVDKGFIVAAGPKMPRTGGFIVVSDIARAELDAMLAEDPFLRRGAARCTVTEFRANFLSPALRRRAE